jgi:hypothetical protein
MKRLPPDSFGPKNSAHEQGNIVYQRQMMYNNLKTEIKEDEDLMGVLKEIHFLKINRKKENPTLRGNPTFNITEDKIVNEFAEHALNQNQYPISSSNRNNLIKSFCEKEGFAIKENQQEDNQVSTSAVLSNPNLTKLLLLSTFSTLLQPASSIPSKLPGCRPEIGRAHV